MNPRAIALSLIGCGLLLQVRAAEAQSSVRAKPAGNGTLTTPQPAPPPPDPARTLAPPRPAKPRDPKTSATDAPATSSAAAAPALDASRAEAPQPATAQTPRLELLVASADMAEAEQQRAWLTTQGAQLLRNLGWVMATYRLAPAAKPEDVARQLSAQWPSSMPELNQRYAALAGMDEAPVEYARALLEWPQSCSGAPRIALLDGAVNEKLATFAGRALQTTVLTPADSTPDYQHATALAALLVGHESPAGLLPHAHLLMGSIMVAGPDGPFSTTEWIVRGLDWVVGLDPAPAVLNLSFGGLRSAQIAHALEKVLEHTVVVAAAGNDGRRAPSYPAAYPGVIAVTAVDARARRWAHANTGDHIAIAAPGVDVWTRGADGRGYYASGTSFAAVFVTAAIAADGNVKSTAEWLARHTRDLGSPGKDPEYGLGALVMRACP